MSYIKHNTLIREKYNIYAGVMEKHNLSCEPMDIDLSSHSIKEMDISYDEPDFIRPKHFIKTEKPDEDNLTEEFKVPNKTAIPQFSGVKKYHIKIQKSTKSLKTPIFQVLLVGFTILISLFIYQIYTLKCYENFNLENLNDILTNKLFGQSEAIDMLIRTLEIEDKSKILFFSGGTGVGKTFVSSILLDSLGPCANIYHYTMPSFTSTFSTDLMLGLIMCKKTLLIVDDLTVSDMQIKIQIKELVDKSENLKSDITVILIYNCYESTKEFNKECDLSFHKRLFENFAEVKALKRFIKFKPLTETHLRQCVKQELGDRKLDTFEFDDLLKNFNVTLDGCKGVHSRIKYLGQV